MAEKTKVKVITDARIIEEVKAIQGASPETKDWSPDKHRLLVFNLMRTNPKLKFASMTKDEVLAAFKQWDADWNNGRLAYPSNLARSLAACEPPLARGELASEFDATGVK